MPPKSHINQRTVVIAALMCILTVCLYYVFVPNNIFPGQITVDDKQGSFHSDVTEDNIIMSTPISIDTTSVKEQTSKSTDRLSKSTSADEKTISKSADEITTLKSADKKTISKSADEITTLKSADEITTSKSADEITTSKSADKITTLKSADEQKNENETIKTEHDATNQKKSSSKSLKGGDGNNTNEIRPIAKHTDTDVCVKRLPQAIVAGIQKSGTSALLTFLERHPQIVACMSPQETQFFTVHYNAGLEWYRQLMPCSYSNQITMEKSPPYFYYTSSIRRIKAMNPRTKIILIVKDPIVRTESMYAMMSSKFKHVPFEDAVTLSNTHQRKLNTLNKLLRFSNYQLYMPYWLKAFHRKQILFVDGHNLESNPAEELRVVERFLNVGTYFTDDMFTYNSTKKKFCFGKGDDDVMCLGSNKGRTHPVYSDNIRTMLEDYFKPLNEKFFKMIGRRFDWGY